MRKALALCWTASVLLAGCATIPTSGPVESGDQVQDVVDAPPVRVLPRDPVAGQSPEEVVSGFLDASASFENDHEVARRFLTAEASDAWSPDAGVTVIDDNPSARLARVGDAVQLSAQQVAQIGRDGAYVPRGGVDIGRLFRLERQGDSWRIAQLPDGLILDRIEVSLAFRSFNIFFMNPQRSFLVPDPVYLPLEQPGSATALVQSLLDGPTRWLRPAVESMVPLGTTLVVDAVPVVNGVARVDLSAEFLGADIEQQELAAAQITETLLELSSTVTGVSITVEGTPLQLPQVPSVFTRDTWSEYDSDDLVPALGGILVRQGVVRQLDGDASRPIEGPLGRQDADVRDPSQSWDGGMVTALTQDRRALLVTEPFLSASVVDRRRGQRLLPATVDGDDRLWSVDVGGAQPRVEVRIDDVWRPAGIERLDGRLTAFRVSVDGTRVAVVVERGAQERGELLLGRVVQGADGLRVEGFRRVELLLVDVRSASWADASSVVVVGGAAGAILEPTSVNLNRTVTTLSGAPLVGVTDVVAAPGQPLLADTPREGVWANSGSGWRFLVAGRDPAYPG
jgi:hypothetical protein